MNARPAVWSVEAFDSAHPDLGWTWWTEWVDRATAEDEKANAMELGYRARIVRAK